MTTLLNGLALCIVFVPGMAVAAPPPSTLPVGIREWSRTGKVADELYLKADDHGRRVAMSSPTGGYPRFTVKRQSATQSQLTFHLEKSPLCSSSLHAPEGFGFLVKRGDVIPLFGELYAIDFRDPEALILRRVTEKVDAALCPSLDSRVISLSAIRPTLFHEEDVNLSVTHFDWVSLAKIESSDVAVVELKPGYAGSKIAKSPCSPARLKAKNGELLSAPGRGHAYNVLNIVPRQEIKGVGELVGWIELSSQPD